MSNVYNQFEDMKKTCETWERVECHDVQTGIVYKEPRELPVWLAELPTEHVYYRYLPR